MGDRAPLPKQVPLADADAGRALRETREALRDLRGRTAGRYLAVDGSEDVVLTNGRVNRLLHGMGRAPVWAIRSLRGATATGRVVEVANEGAEFADPAEDLWLDVQGHGADITVRIWME